MRVDMAGVDATLGQDVDPDIFELQRPLAKVEFQIPGKLCHMCVKHRDQIGKDRKPPGQVAERGVRGIAGITVLFAPVLTRFIIFSDDEAGVFQLGWVDGSAMFGQLGVIKAGREEGFDVGHADVLAQAACERERKIAKDHESQPWLDCVTTLNSLPARGCFMWGWGLNGPLLPHSTGIRVTS